MDPTRGAAESIFTVGSKVEVSFEEADLRGVWFPATVTEELGNNLFLVEYQCSGINGEPELCHATVDQHHIRPLTPPVRDTDFFLLEKVDAFYDFGWWTGVITKKLADSRYIVYFKHTNKEREVGHLELRLHVEHGESSFVKRVNEERATVLLNFTGPIEDTNPGIEKQTSIVATTMKRTKANNVGNKDKHLKPSKKLKSGVTVTFDDQIVGVSDVVPVKKGSKATVGQSGQTLDKTEISSRGKRMLVKRGKGIELKSPVITSARKKRISTAGSRGDLFKITTPKIVEKVHVNKELAQPITCVMGLQCKVITDSMPQPKKVKSPTINALAIVESEIPESGAVPLVEESTVVPDEGKKADGGTILKKKRGRPFKSQPKTPLAVNHENGDAAGKEKKKTPAAEAVSVEKLTSSGKASTTTKTVKHLETYQSVKGKRGKRRKIISINTVSPSQGGQDSSSKQKEKEKEKEKTKEKTNGWLENESLDIVAVEKSSESISDDQPLSKWFESAASVKKQIETTLKSPSPPPSPSTAMTMTMTTTSGQDLSFEKRSTLWATLEAMELFQVIPQKPHFRPLDKEKECTREGQAISKMVTYLRVVEATSQLQLDSPRSTFEDNMEALADLESHGFDVKAVRERLNELLEMKERVERIEEESKKVRERMEVERGEVERFDKEIELVDKQVVALLEKRGQVLKKKEKKAAEVGALEAEVDGIKEGLDEIRSRFDGLAAEPFSVSDQQTPPPSTSTSA